MRLLSCILLGCFLLVLAPINSIAQQKFTTELGKFSVLLPNDYEVQSEQKPNGHFFFVNAQPKNELYMVSSLISDSGWGSTDTKTLNRMFLEVMIKKVGGSVKSKKHWKHKGYDGLEVVLKKDRGNNKEITIYRVIHIGNIQYMLMYSSKGKKFDRKKMKLFFKSFQSLE